MLDPDDAHTPDRAKRKAPRSETFSVVATLGPGEVFGKMALIDSAPRIATATAVSDTKVVPVNEKRFKFLVQQTPHFALLMLRVLTERLRRMNGLL